MIRRLTVVCVVYHSFFRVLSRESVFSAAAFQAWGSMRIFIFSQLSFESRYACLKQLIRMLKLTDLAPKLPNDLVFIHSPSDKILHS